MLKSYKYRIYPNNAQQVLIAKHFGACRWVYNEALAFRVKHWQDSKKHISWAELSARLPGLKVKDETSWLKEINAQSLASQIIFLEKAYQSFFKDGSGFPSFKKRRGRQSFPVTQGIKVDFTKSLFRIPKFEWIKFSCSQSFEGAVKRASVSRDPSGKYFVSFLVETGLAIPNKTKYSDLLGIDLGLTTFATLSNGEKIDNPRMLKKSLKKLARAQRKLSRKKKGSTNRDKQRRKVALVHEKVRNQRQDFLHKLTSKIVRENQAIAIEDLNVEGMRANRKLSRAVSDAAWSEFRRQLEYKCDWYGKTLITIGRFEPSSKLCTCGVINRDLKLSHRTWTCSSCNATHDRDVLAANNIKSFALGRVTPEFTPVESSRRKASRRSRKAEML